MGIPQPTDVKESERDRKEPAQGICYRRWKNDMKIKEGTQGKTRTWWWLDSRQLPLTSSPSSAPPNHTNCSPPMRYPISLVWPSPRCSDPPTPSSLHGVPMPHSLPLTLSAMHQMGSLNALETHPHGTFYGSQPFRSRSRPPSSSGISLGSPTRSLPKLWPSTAHGLPAAFWVRTPLPWSLRSRTALSGSRATWILPPWTPLGSSARKERLRHQAEERERMHLREELDRARLHQLHQSPIEGHLPHMPPFMSHLGGMPYPRLSPSTGHNGLLNRTPQLQH